MRYIDKIEGLPSTDANNALIIGTAMHTGLEKGVEEAIKTYYNSFPIITDEHINEAIKLEYLIPKVQEILPEGEYELQIMNSDFVGFIDLTSRNEDGSYDIYDFKYSNNVNSYMDSRQLHLYKYFFEKQYKKKVRNLNFVFIPKVNIKQKSTENIISFRKRILEELEASEIKVVQVQFDIEKVIEFYQGIKRVLETKEFPKEPSYLCNWCEYQDYCEKGVDYMLLPENKRREKIIDLNPDMWVYGDSYVGKSTFVDQFDDLLFINTDGNTDNTTSPVIRIADQVTLDGRMTKRKMAWDVFLDVVTELEKKQNDFKRIAIDLVEDLYEHCRLYIYNKLGIEHEQDAGYGKGWDMVRTEFLSTIKRLKNIGYQIIYISKEITQEITLKSGSKITTFRPNINEKVANVLAGTVDLTIRAYMDGEQRFLQSEKKETVFGGGRFSFKVDKIPLNKEAFLEALKDAQESVKENNPTTQTLTIDSSTQVNQGDSFTQKVQETKPTSTDTEEPRSERKTRKRRGE